MSRPSLDANAWRVIIARLISRTGGEAGFFVGVWGTAAYALDATPGSLALLMAAMSVASMIGAAVAGVLVDRFDPRRVLIASEVVFVPAILTLTTVGSMAEMTVRAPLVWLVGSIGVTAITAFPPALAADEDRVARTNTLMEAAGTIAFVLGPALGALTVRLVDLPAVFVLDAATSVVAVLLLVPVRVRRVEARERGTGLAELRAGFRYAYRSRAIVLILALGSLTWLSFGAFGALEPLFYRDVLGTGPEALGYLNSVFGVGLFLGAFTLDRNALRATNLRTVVVLTAACGIGALIYVGTSSLVVVAVGAVVWGVLLGALMPLLRTLLHLHTGEGYVGRVSGVYLVHKSVGELAPLAVAPALAALFGVQRVLLASGVLLLVLAPTAWRRASRLDGERPVRPLADRGLAERVEDLEERVPLA
ncbi:MAG: MFS transporter [Actinobacteria bacterium]|nr:MFS transporter [Actinomycetota bacterium]